MPNFFNIGMAMSILHVVGLQEPPKKTRHKITIKIYSMQDIEFILKEVLPL